MRTLLGLIGLLLLAAVAAAGPNLIWLARSTARITNESRLELGDLRLEVGGRELVIGTAPPGLSRFVFLPETGDATLRVSYWIGPRELTGCQEYVGGSMYHVDIRIARNLEARCVPQLPLFDRLFWQVALGL